MPGGLLSYRTPPPGLPLINDGKEYEYEVEYEVEDEDKEEEEESKPAANFKQKR